MGTFQFGQNLNPEKNLVKQIRLLVAKNKIGHAIDYAINLILNDQLYDEYLNDIILISAKYNQLLEECRTNTLSYNEQDIIRSKLIKSLLGILEQL